MAASNNALAHYKQSRGYDQILHASSNIHGLYGCSCNLLDVLSVYSLNLSKLPDRFSNKWPEYETKSAYVYQVLDFIWCKNGPNMFTMGEGGGGEWGQSLPTYGVLRMQ